MAYPRCVCLLLSVVLPASALAAAAPGLLREHRFTRGKEATAAVLNANGGYVMEKQGAKVREGNAPNCAVPCEQYAGGATKHTAEVCLSAGPDYICSDDASCANGDAVCTQLQAYSDCNHACSEWSNGDVNSPVVCQENSNHYRCNIKGSCDSSIETRCRQLDILSCPTTCASYDTVGFTAPTHDSMMVCQDQDASQSDNNYGVCHGLPCTNSGTTVCQQNFDDCANPCAAGSTHDSSWQITHLAGSVDTVVCRSSNGVCTSDPACSSTVDFPDAHRCVQVYATQDATNVHTQDDSGGMVR